MDPGEAAGPGHRRGRHAAGPDRDVLIIASVSAQSRRTAEFYDRWTPAFCEAFGTTLQAGLLGPSVAEATDADASALLLAERAGVTDGDRLLDAGCGVGGPAVAIATRHRRCRIDGITVSRAQAHEAATLARQRSIDERVGVTRGDYHALPFRDACFDGALFLESIGYSPDHGTLFAEACRVVRPGGRIYVKDVFLGAADPESLPAPRREDLRRFEELWCLSASPTFGGVAAALVGAGCEVLRCGELADVGTAHMLAAMIEPDPDLIFRLTPLGETFATPSLDLPLVFGEVLAVVG